MGLLSFLKGDLPGHPLRGNQYTEGLGIGGLRGLYERVSHPDGGFTYNPRSETEPSTGYAVSIYEDRSKAFDAKALTFKDLWQYALHNRDLLSQEGNHLGAWNDPHSGKVFLDVSKVVDTPEEAHALSLKHDQIAYFGLKEGKSFTVNQNAKSGGVIKGVSGGQTRSQSAQPQGQEPGGYGQVFVRAVRKTHGEKANRARTVRGYGRVLEGRTPYGAILKFNPNHAPAGSPEGGQFTSGDQSGAGAAVDDKGAGTQGNSTPPGQMVASPGVPQDLVKAIEDHIDGIGGVANQHTASDVTEWLMRTHKQQMLGLIDGLSKDKRPTLLLHKGDEAKGIPSVWLLGWSAKEGTDIHDHLRSEVGISVVRGQVVNRFFGHDQNYVEESKTPAGTHSQTQEQTLREGSTTGIPSPYIHEMFGRSQDNSAGQRDVTVHAYFPPLKQMHYFTKDAQGNLHYDGDWDEDRPPSEYSSRKAEHRLTGCSCGGMHEALWALRRN